MKAPSRCPAPHRPGRSPSHARLHTHHRAASTATLEALLSCRPGSNFRAEAMPCRQPAWPRSRAVHSNRRTGRSRCLAARSPVPM